jgi:hypothetical protein
LLFCPFSGVLSNADKYVNFSPIIVASPTQP